MRAPFCSESSDFCPEEKDIIGSENKNENEICAIEQNFQKARASKTAVFGICLEDLMGTSPNIVPQIPFIISRICNFIETHGMREKSLFLNGDEESLVENLREEFSECGDASLESTGHVASIAKLLIIFLEELPEPLVPVSAQPAFIKDIEKLSLNPMECLSSLKGTVEKLPDSTYQVLKYLSRFLMRVTCHKEYNGLNSNSLAVIFGPLIFRPSPKNHQIILSFRDIVNCFVKDYYTIFENGEYECQDFVSQPHLPSALSLKVSRQPCPSSIMPVMSLSPLSVVIPADKDKSISENEISGIPLLLIEGQPNVKCKNKKVINKNKISSNVIGIVLTRKRKERRFSGEDAQQRSSSEERPSPNSVAIETSDAMRRCNSHEEVMNHEKEIEQSLTNGNHNLKFVNSFSHNIELITNGSNLSPHPPTAKRREIEREDVSSDVSWISSTMDDEEINQPTSFSKIEQNSIAESPKNTIMECDNLDNLSSDAFIEESENIINSAANIPRSSSCPIPKSDNGNSSDSETDSLSLSWSMLFEDSEPVRAEPHLNLSKEVHNETLLSPSVQSLRRSEYYEAPLSPSAFRSYLSYRGTHLDPSIPPSPPVEQENFAKKPVETTSVTDSIKQLTKKIHNIKKRIRKYDDKFEAEYGFKPSHAEKSNNFEVKKLLSDLYKARKELKALKEEAHLEHVGTSWHVARSHILEDTTNQFANEVSKNRITVEDSFGQTLRSLADDRKSANRPEAVDDMTNDQVKDEKIAIQKALLNYEKVHGKPVTRHDRETCRPLYERYRCIKRLLLRSGSFPGGTPKAKDLYSDLQPILEHETMEFPARQKPYVEEVQNDVKEIAAETTVSTTDSQVTTTSEEETNSSFLAMKYDNSNLHELPLSEMLFHMQNIKSEKRRLRKSLKEFEVEFLRSKGKKVQKDDKMPVEALYNEYKHIKARLKLLEALISKHDQHQLM